MQTKTNEKNNYSEKLKGLLVRRKIILIIIAVVLVIAIVAGIFISAKFKDVAETVTTPQSEALRIMDLEQIVSGTGTIQSRTSREVTSSANYKISEIFVSEGDWVEKDQTLAVLDSTDLDKEIADLKESIAEAEEKDADSLKAAEKKLADAISTRNKNAKKNDKSIQEALGNIEQARKDAGKKALEEGAVEYATEKSNAAKSTMSSAQSALSAVQSEYSSKDTAYNTLVEYKRMYNAAADSESKESLLTSFGYESIDKLEAAINTVAEEKTAIEPKLEAAKSTYDKAAEDYENTYDEAYSSYKASNTSVYRKAYENADVSQLKSTYEKAVDTKETTYENDTDSIEAAQDSLASQKKTDNAKSYRSSLESLLENKANCIIMAPSAGTVTEITAEVGKAPTGSAALFTIENTNKIELSVTVPEYDVPNVKIGMPVTITSDAFDGKEWDGTVSVISSKATDTNGNFTVTVDIISDTDKLAIGMSAKANIIIDTKEDVFAVPFDAVTENEQGEKIIYITNQSAKAQNSPDKKSETDASSTNREAIIIETGMETDYYIEIISNELKEGMLVLTDPEGKNVPASTGGFPFPNNG